MKKFLKSTINCILGKFGFQLQRASKLGSPNPIHLWDDIEEFNRIYNEIREHTLVDKTRCFMLYQFSKQVECLQGEVAEVGVYKGGTAKLLAQVFEEQNKTVYLFDTFSGMPESDPKKDIHKKGDFNDTSLESIRDFLRGYNNVELYQGFFPGTAKPIMSKQFCFVHIDVDIYKSVIDCCEFFYKRMTKGGIIVFDDYGFLSCKGAKIAIDEFLSDKGEYPTYLPTGQCFIVKI